MFKINKKLLLILSTLFIHKSGCMDLELNPTKLDQAVATTTSQNAIIPAGITENLIRFSKNCIPTAAVLFCNKLKNPYKLLITSEITGLTYLIYLNSCEHSAPLLEAITDQFFNKKLLQKSVATSLLALTYSAGESTYNVTKQNNLVKNILGNGAIVVICLNLVCQQCLDKSLNDLQLSLVNGLAINRVMEITEDLTKKINKEKSTLISLAKKPIIIGTIALGGIATAAYCMDINNTNFNNVIPEIVSTIEQAVIYTYSLKLGKALCLALYKKAMPIINKFRCGKK